METVLPERKPNETYRWEAFVEFFNGKDWVLEQRPIYVKTSKEDKAREKVLESCSANCKTSKKNFKINSLKVVGVTNKTN